MDPNVTLEDILDNIENGWYEDAAADFEALHEWLSKGGSKPAAWL